MFILWVLGINLSESDTIESNRTFTSLGIGIHRFSIGFDRKFSQNRSRNWMEFEIRNLITKSELFCNYNSNSEVAYQNQSELFEVSITGTWFVVDFDFPSQMTRCCSSNEEYGIVSIPVPSVCTLWQIWPQNLYSFNLLDFITFTPFLYKIFSFVILFFGLIIINPF